MNKRNRYDELIEDLAKRFSQIPNFNLTQKNESARRLFLFVIKRYAELHSFKGLFLNNYIPQSSRAIAEDLQELNRSKYKPLLVISKDEIHENYYETVRLGYVGLFHKYENYINDLIQQTEFYLNEEWHISESFYDYVKRKFNYNLKDWKSSSIVYRINWICNCVKHKDGYPIKPDKPVSLAHLTENERIKLTKDDLKADIAILEQHYIIMLTLVMTIALYRIICDDGQNNGVPQEKQLELEHKMKDLIAQLI